MKQILFIGFLISMFVGIDSNIAAQVEMEPTVMDELIRWRHIGPFRGGRSCAVVGVKEKPNLYYFGATGGGVWRTDDAGLSWENISDGYFGGSIGAVAVAESDPNVIYVGGGEKTVRGNVSSGYGVWKTMDAGETWEFAGLPSSKHIPRIRIHPQNPNIVYAAVLGDLYKSSTERGIYKSTDGGKAWKKVLYSNPDAGAIDLVIDPNNPRHMYASTWNVRRTPYSLSSGGPGSALWKSTDAGETWTNISSNEGLPEGLWGISGISVSAANSSRLYAIIENEKGGVYRSDDKGKSWKLVNETRALRQRAWYYTRIYADPADEDIVYVVNVDYHKSTDGGKTFKAHRAPHGDHHDLWINPDQTNAMVIADDGGAQVTLNGGKSWSTYQNQPTAQFYRVTTDDAFPYRIYVAQQDNSTLRIKHRTKGKAITRNDWEETAGGESAHLAIHPENNDFVIGGSYDGFLIAQDHEKDTKQAINVWPDNPMGHGAEDMRYRFQWNFPVIYSQSNGHPLLTGSNHVHLSRDNGKSWETISPDLTRNDSTKLGPSGGPITKDNTSVEYYCTIFAMKESPLEPGMIWLGTDDGRVHYTPNLGDEWIEATPKNAPKWLMINSIEPDPFNKAGCYIAGTLYKTGDFKPYLYKTENYGKSWTKIDQGIPNNHFTRVLRADPTQQGVLYAGTETGMYLSLNDGKSWKSLQTNLPIVPVTDLAIKNNNLIAATQGRSIWMLDDLTLIHQLPNATSNRSEETFLKPADSYRFGGGTSEKIKNAGQNHHSGVEFNFILPQYTEKDTITLSIQDGDGKEIMQFGNHKEDKKEKMDIKQGVNTFVWNMHYPKALDFEGMIFWWGKLDGAKALPGTYQAVLSTPRGQKTQAFTILPANNSQQSLADIESQFTFLNKVNETVSEAHQCIIDIRKINKQLKSQKEQMKNNADIADEIGTTIEGFEAIEKNLYQTKNQSRQDPLNFPIRLTNKLAHLNSLASIGDAAPTEQMEAVRQELTSEIQMELKRFENLKMDAIPKLNQMIKNAAVDPIQIPESTNE